MLSSVSADYTQKIQMFEDEKNILYVINETPLTEHHESSLMKLKKEQIKELVLLTPEETKKKYGINKKEGGVKIITF
jgi:hypothetical protein